MEKSTLHRRFTAGVTGQAYTRVAYLASTVVLVPILIGAWGLEGYGEWIALTALATYFSYSNFGIVTTSANEIVMAIGALDEQRALRAFQMSINIIIYIVLPILILLLALLTSLPISSILKLSVIGTWGAIAILVFSAGQLFISTVRGILVAALYATGSYGLAYFITGTMKIIELSVVSTFVLIWGAQQISVSAAITCIALMDLIVIYLFARRAASWVRFDMRLFDVKWLRAQIKPAIGFIISNFSTQGIIVQGPRVLLSVIVGPETVAIYSVYGTAMRLIDQLILMIALPMEIEIAHCIGRNDREKAYSLIVSGTQIGWLAFGTITVGFLIAGNMIFRFLTQGRVTFNLSLMALFLIMSACNQIGRINAHALIAANRMYGPSIITLVGCLVGLLIGGILTHGLGLLGMAAGIIIAELFYSIVVIQTNMRWMGRRIIDFIYDVCNVRRAVNLGMAGISKYVSGRKGI